MRLLAGEALYYSGGSLGENDSALFWEREVDDELVVVDDKFPLKKVSWSGKSISMKV